MNRLRLPTLSLLALLAIVALSACSGGTGAAPQEPDSGRPADGTGSNGFDAQPSPATGSFAPGDQQLIVYTGTLDLEVSDLPQTVDQADQLVAGLGGHVASSSTSDKGAGQYATVTYRIPAEHWDEALAGLHALGTRVLSETTQSEDVTGQVVDLDARLANLRVTETALQSIMDQATTIDDVLNVQRELTSVRGDIESMTAQRDQLASRAALATLAVTFEVPVAETSVAQGSWDLGSQIDSALAALVRLGQGAITLIVWVLIVLVPILVPVLIVLYIAVRLRRRWLRTHPRPQQMGPPPGMPSM